MQMRYGKIEDYENAKNIWKKCFVDSQEEIEFYFKNLYNKNNYLILEKDGEIIASLHENKYGLSIDGKLFPSIYIVGVAVLPEFRNKGYMNQLLSYSLENARKKGYSFLYLSAINSAIYRKYGFEYVSELEIYNFDIQQISGEKVDKSMEIKALKKDNFESYLQDLIMLYEKKMEKYFCYIKRDERVFSNLIKEVFEDQGEVYIFYRDNYPVGYIIIYRGEKIVVREFYGVNKSIVENILIFIKSFKEYYKEVEIKSSQGENINFYFSNQKLIEKRSTPFIMGRIINIVEFFKKIKIDIKEIKMFVEDELISSNTANYYFKQNGKIEILDTDDWDLKIDIGSLGSLLFGYLDIETLIFMGKVFIKSEKIRIIESLKPLYMRKTYIQDYQ